MRKPNCKKCEWRGSMNMLIPLATTTFSGNTITEHRCEHPRSQLGDFSSMESLLERAVTGCPKLTAEWRC